MYSIGIDIGTSSAKGVLFGEAVTVLAEASAQYETHFPVRGWADQNPKDWWKAVIHVIQDLLKQYPAAPEEIGAVSISSQAPTVMFVDENGEPMSEAIIWMDRRSDEECELLKKQVGFEKIFSITGTRVDPYYVYPELYWAVRHRPEELKKAVKLLQVNGYINYLLTGVYSIDIVHATHTQMYDINKKKWSEELFREIGVDPDIFPEVYECGEKIGEVTEEAAALTGLAKGTAVLCGTVDGAAAVLEAGVTGGSQAVEMTGTSTGLMIAFDELYTSRNMAHMFHIVPGKHILYGAMSTTGASYQWVRNQLYDHARVKKNAYKEMDQEIMKEAADPTSILFLPYMQGERCPIWDTNALGAYIGLDLRTTRAQIMRATLEGVGLALMDNAMEARKNGVEIAALTSVGGCSASPLWNRIKASILNIPISVPEKSTGATGGLGIMMSVFLGEYRDLQEAVDATRPAMTVYEPVAEWVDHYRKMYEIYSRCYSSMKDRLHELSALSVGPK